MKSVADSQMAIDCAKETEEIKDVYENELWGGKMPSLKCNNCGGTTNTAACTYNLRDPGAGASECYVRFEGGKWVKGCAYDEDNELMKSVADSLMAIDSAKGNTLEFLPSKSDLNFVRFCVPFLVPFPVQKITKKL